MKQLKAKHDRSLQARALRRVLRYVRPHTPLLGLSLILNLLTVGLSLLVPILIGRGIDCVIGPANVDFPALAALLVKVLACVGASAVCQWLAGVLNNRLTYITVRDIRRDAFRHIQDLPLSFLDSRPTGDTVSRMITDVDTFADGLLMGFTQLFSGVMTILGTLAFMLALSPLTTLAVVVLTPVSLFVAKFIASRTYDMFRLQSVTRGEQTALIDEVVGNEKLVRAFSHEQASMDQFDEINERLRDCSLKATFFSSLVNPSTRFVNSLVYAAVALIGAMTVLSGGALTIGGLTSFLSYASQYTKPFNEISGVITELQNALACAGRIFELMDEAPQTPDPENAPDLPDVKGDFSLRDVAFSYDPSVPLIRSLSLEAAPGMRVAIVGPTGCGKTTLINLLMRFYDVDGGTISLDGTETRSLARGTLRRNVGMVLQDTWLPAGTVREIISFGRPDATEEEIIAAAKASHAHSFIRRLPQGYDTPIAEGGGSLSQGQQQLLCITRVMLCLPPVLILDEATSSIDVRTEQRIQKAFAAMMQGRTSFIVAHRLSTIRNADIILVMKDGNVVEQGTHDSLLRKNGAYAALYRSQFEQ
ncbi:MAG: ABC transporter ATP-binding protein/permease [Clostridiales bacterium]|nr:ABC transporter ATP-binding protein/permease [Clostridiales bacterium]